MYYFVQFWSHENTYFPLGRGPEMVKPSGAFENLKFPVLSRISPFLLPVLSIFQRFFGLHSEPRGRHTEHIYIYIYIVCMYIYIYIYIHMYICTYASTRIGAYVCTTKCLQFLTRVRSSARAASCRRRRDGIQNVYIYTYIYIYIYI